MTTVVSIKNLFSQITKECSHIISLFPNIKTGAEEVKKKWMATVIKNISEIFY